MNREQRLDAVHAAICRLAQHPAPHELADGLSPAMAAACLGYACGMIGRDALDQATRVPGRPPRLAAVVAARGVFTAPLEWVALLAAADAAVILKAPAASPAFGQAVATAFAEQGLRVRCTTDHALPPVDALVAMGSDETIAALTARHTRARLSMHGHRFSLAVVRGSGPALARALASDALLYDGRGCFTPAAVLHLGDPEDAHKLVRTLAEALDVVAQTLPPGPRDPLLGPEWRRRTGLAKALGAPGNDRPPSATLLDVEHFEAAVLPGYLPVHPVEDPESLHRLLAPWRPWLAGCATDLDLEEHTMLLDVGFERLCLPGALQRPPLPRTHGGREMLRPLMRQPSVER